MTDRSEIERAGPEGAHLETRNSTLGSAIESNEAQLRGEIELEKQRLREQLACEENELRVRSELHGFYPTPLESIPMQKRSGWTAWFDAAFGEAGTGVQHFGKKIHHWFDATLHLVETWGEKHQGKFLGWFSGLFGIEKAEKTVAELEAEEKKKLEASRKKGKTDKKREEAAKKIGLTKEELDALMEGYQTEEEKEKAKDEKKEEKKEAA